IAVDAEGVVSAAVKVVHIASWIGVKQCNSRRLAGSHHDVLYENLCRYLKVFVFILCDGGSLWPASNHLVIRRGPIDALASKERESGCSRSRRRSIVGLVNKPTHEGKQTICSLESDPAFDFLLARLDPFDFSLAKVRNFPEVVVNADLDA